MDLAFTFCTSISDKIKKKINQKKKEKKKRLNTSTLVALLRCESPEVGISVKSMNDRGGKEERENEGGTK